MEEFYPSGARASLFSEGGSGQVYYPSGKVSVVIACSKTENGTKYQWYFYDDDRQGTLLGSLDEHVVGGAMEHGKSPSSLKFTSTRKSGIVSTQGGDILFQWKWDRNAQDAGSLPPLPLKMSLNESLQLVFNSRRDIIVTFKSGSFAKDFQCGEQLRRTQSYLDGCTVQRLQKSAQGQICSKIIPRMTFKTLQERQAELMDKLAHVRNLNKPCSSNIRHMHEVKAVMQTLEKHFEPYEEKIKREEFASTFPDPEWRDVAKMNTMLQVPRIKTTGDEVGQAPPLAEFGSLLSQQEMETLKGKISVASELPKKWPTELQVRLDAEKRNPTLRRPYVLRNASGRYSRTIPVNVELQDMKKLECLDPQSFDAAISRQDGKLTVVLCIREDDSQCTRARQLFEMINADLVEQANALPWKSGGSTNQEDAGDNRDELSLPPCEVFQFAMTHSRFLTDRFGIHTLPAYLMFFNGKLVRANIMGARHVNLCREEEPPRLLLVEPTQFKSQLQIEKLLKRLNFESDLAISTRDAASHIKFRAGITSANATTYYGLVLIDSDVSIQDVQTITSLARRASSAADRGCTLVVSLLPMGSVPRSNIEDGIVKNPSTGEHLLDGLCDVAALRPLKSTTMERLMKEFIRLQKSTRGQDAAEPLENLTHYGFKKADLRREIQAAFKDAQQSRFLQTSYRLGMKLPANKAVFRGVRLEHGEHHHDERLLTN